MSDEESNSPHNDAEKSFKESEDSCGFSNGCSTKHNSSVLHLDLNSANNPPPTDNLLCLRKSEQYFDHLEVPVSKWSKKTTQELNKYSLKQLQIFIEDLTHAVEEVSSELVQLLLENDALQQESDARNIAIEQLLKMTVKANDSDLKPIQMSVILPDEDCDDVI